MSDILIVHQFENMIINVFGMHFDFIILHVSTIMEVPLLGVQIGPCLKCKAPELLVTGIGTRLFPPPYASRKKSRKSGPWSSDICRYGYE